MPFNFNYNLSTSINSSFNSISSTPYLTNYYFRNIISGFNLITLHFSYTISKLKINFQNTINVN